MNGAEKTVLEEGHHVGLGGLLEAEDSCGLEPQVFGTNLNRERGQSLYDFILKTISPDYRSPG